MATRLYFIVARNADVAVVFRRGPTRQVELLRWNLRTDEIEPGQWLKGRIYERRSDLSSNGEYLIYFAAKYETGLRTWTAISRPPYLTALALWPKGDAWGGGGLFDTERRVRLNHRDAEMALGEGFRLTPAMRVIPLGEHAGWGEDEPIHHVRLMRDGWSWVDRESKWSWVDRESKTIERGARAGRWITFDPPIVYRRDIGRDAARVTLEMSIEGLKETDGSWYVTTYRLLNGRRVVRDLGRADWADRAPDGDLLIARDGQLLRATASTPDEWVTVDLREVADLSSHAFESRKAPPAAQHW